MAPDATRSGTVPAPLRPGAEAVALSLAFAAGIVVLTLAAGLPGQRLGVLCAVNVCAVLSFQMFSGNSGVVSFGHTAFMGVGAYVSAWMTMPPAMLARALPNLPGWMGGYELPLAGALGVVALAGLALALLTGWPIARLNGASASIATLGFLIIVYSVMAAAQDFTQGNRAFYGVPRLVDIWVATGAACVFILVARLYRESRWGLMLRAVRDDETAAAASGVSPVPARLLAWVLSGAAGMVAGALYGHMLGAFSPRDFYFDLAFGYVAMMILGGMGTVTGAVGGVVLVMGLRDILQRLEGGVTLGPVALPDLFGLQIVGVSLAILLVLKFRPDGLFGRRELALPAAWLPRRPVPLIAPAPAAAAGPLSIAGVGKRFAGLVALHAVRAEIPPARVTGLIGPNGAGKSTLVNAIGGLSPATEGAVRLGAMRLDTGPAHRVARAGVARTFQNIRLFPRLTVEENVAVAALAAGQTLAAARRSAARELAGLGIAGLAEVPAAALPYGARRRLEVARALAVGPRFLMLDEPAAGMNPEETADLERRLREIAAARGIGLLLIDHDLRFVMALCDRVVVLNRGEVIAEGPPDAIRRDPAVIEAYLGTRASRDAKATRTEVTRHATGEDLSHAEA
jgi:branched-chain amino acid transport system permease protein